MKRSSVLVAIAFLAGLGIGLRARDVTGMQQRRSRAMDLAAIERLHRIDIDATLTQDPKGLLAIWTEDAVRFMPGGPPSVGKQAIQADNEKARAQYPGFKVLSYSAKYKDLQIEDGLACEWGEHEAQYKLSSEAPPANWRGDAFHVLKRQSDGSWEFAALIGGQ